jgi:hypothetical protein
MFFSMAYFMQPTVEYNWGRNGDAQPIAIGFNSNASTISFNSLLKYFDLKLFVITFKHQHYYT